MAKKLSATLEDYLRVVLRYQQKKSFARVSDISAALGVAKSAVTTALQSLAAKGLLNYQPYEPVTLTKEGARRAEEILLCHRIIFDFLRNILAIEPHSAELIACEMEHAINRPALEKFICFLAFMGSRNAKGKKWLDEFQKFTKSGANGQSCGECIRKYIRKTHDSKDSIF